MAAKKPNTEGLQFLVDALKKNKDAVYADLRAAAEKKGLTVYPIMFGRAKLLLGLAKAGKGKAKAAGKKTAATKGKPGRQADPSSKSGQVRALLATGMSVADIAKKVGCTVGLVYNVKSTSGAKSKRGPGRPPKVAVVAGPRRGPGRPRKNAGADLNGLEGVVAAIRQSQQQVEAYRRVFTQIVAAIESLR